MKLTSAVLLFGALMCLALVRGTVGDQETNVDIINGNPGIYSADGSLKDAIEADLADWQADKVACESDVGTKRTSLQNAQESHKTAADSAQDARSDFNTKQDLYEQARDEEGNTNVASFYLSITGSHPETITLAAVDTSTDAWASSTWAVRNADQDALDAAVVAYHKNQLWYGGPTDGGCYDFEEKTSHSDESSCEAAGYEWYGSTGEYDSVNSCTRYANGGSACYSINYGAGLSTDEVTVAAGARDPESGSTNECCSRFVELMQHRNDIATVDSSIEDLNNTLGEHQNQYSNEVPHQDTHDAIALLQDLRSDKEARISEIIAADATEKDALDALKTTLQSSQSAQNTAKADRESADSTLNTAFDLLQDTKIPARDSTGDAVVSAEAALTTAIEDCDTDRANMDASVADLQERIGELTDILKGHSVDSRKGLWLDGRRTYVELPSQDFTNGFTLEAWVHFDPSSDDRLNLPAIAQADVEGYTQQRFVFLLQMRGGPVEEEAAGEGSYEYYYYTFKMGSTDQDIYAVKLYGTPFNPRGWHHVAVTCSETNGDGQGTVSLFVNGVLQKSVMTSAQRLSTDNKITVGKYHDYAGSHFSSGMVDEVRIWSDARSVTDILGSATETLVGDESDLLAYYRFDEDEAIYANTVKDSTNNRHDGTIVEPSGEAKFPTRRKSDAFKPAGSEVHDSGYSIYFRDGGINDYVDLPLPVCLDNTCAGPYVSDGCWETDAAITCEDEYSSMYAGQFTAESWWFYDPSLDDSTNGKFPKMSQASDDTSRNKFSFTLEMVEPSSGNYKYQFKAGDDNADGYVIELESGTHSTDPVSGAAVPSFVSSGWHHVAVTVDELQRWKLYVDGVENDAGDASDGSGAIVSGHPWQIGRINDDEGAHMMIGKVDEVRFWNIARSVDDINAYMKKVLPSKQDQDELFGSAHQAMRSANSKILQGLMAYYRFEEPKGHKFVVDSSDQHNDGLLHGTRSRTAGPF